MKRRVKTPEIAVKRDKNKIIVPKIPAFSGSIKKKKPAKIIKEKMVEMKIIERDRRRLICSFRLII